MTIVIVESNGNFAIANPLPEKGKKSWKKLSTRARARSSKKGKKENVVKALSKHLTAVRR